MLAPTQNTATPRLAVLASLAWLLAALGAFAAIILLTSLDLSAPTLAVSLAAAPFVVGAGLIILAHTPSALCIIAFSIVPLGIIQVEIASVTVSLPEVLILILFSKEVMLILLRGESVHPAVPTKHLALYLGIGAMGLIVSVFYGNNFVAALQDSRQFLEFVVLYLLVLHRVRDRGLIKRILASYVAGSALVALHGILERFTGLGIPTTQLISDLVYHEFVRSGSVYGATALGALMVLSLGPTIGLILSSKSMLVKMLLSGLCVLFLVAAVFTNTRASWLAILILLAFVFVSVRKKPSIIIAAVVGALVFSIILGPVIYKRMAMIEVSKKERSLLERVQYYTVAWHIFRSHPTLGLGWGSHYDMKDILVNGRYVRTAQPTLPEHMGKEKVTVHSAYLQILVKTGLAGLLSFFIVLAHWGMWVLRERRAGPKDELDHNLFIGLTGAIIGYLFHAAGENFFQWPVMSQSFWMFLGLSTLMAYKLVHEGALNPQTASVEEDKVHVRRDT